MEEGSLDHFNNPAPGPSNFQPHSSIIFVAAWRQQSGELIWKKHNLQYSVTKSIYRVIYSFRKPNICIPVLDINIDNSADEFLHFKNTLYLYIVNDCNLDTNELICILFTKIAITHRKMYKFLLLVLIGVVVADECKEDTCALVLCQVAECKKGEIFVEKGGFCGCCNACRTVKKEGECCRIEEKGVPPTEQCEDGTTCKDVGDEQICVRDCD
ncbi:uncharacterized protein TNCT_129531 [Trichonephila clavata]|uniref:IGFBP N-terminal domain-containing protein n=1 Tax=Trichonephila clavata TaxID=2740835 RepID=A0A8X6LWG5_TRICU|nr:uncharacterized protein TNCT_129531 [Trichonephila clavata]